MHWITVETFYLNILTFTDIPLSLFSCLVIGLRGVCLHLHPLSMWIALVATGDQSAGGLIQCRYTAEQKSPVSHFCFRYRTKIFASASGVKMTPILYLMPSNATLRMARRGGDVQREGERGDMGEYR